ncbi:MAG: arginine--tRNA ligase, partial [Candidatus Liptonbacteria bacterium CG11_big_fil_rev_8_21_14_0_20_35_14]
MKAFHIGHFRGITIGESLVRLFEALGYKVVRANYQGDVGPHVAKSLWGVLNMDEEYEKVKSLNNKEKAEFLGRAYAYASQQYEEKEGVKKEILDINKSIYNILEGAKDDSKIYELYKETRQWSLDYFEDIYKKLDSHFDKYYFESETFSLGKKLVLKNVGSVFQKSQDAIIYPGEKKGLHNRVFITSEGNATYEAKDLALAYKKQEDFKPDQLVVITAKEQNEYFKILFKAIDEVLPDLKNK